MSNISLFELITATSTLDSFYKEVFCIQESKKAINDSIINNEEKNKSVIFKNYKYAGEILERFVDHLDEIPESELESLAVISSIAIFHKSFTRYGNQIELGYENLVKASEKYPENQLLKVSVHLYDLFKKESKIDYNSTELINLFKELETNQLDYLLQVLIAASINSLPYSHWDPMAKTLLTLEKPKRILSVISTIFYVLTEQKYKELSQFNRVFMFIYAGLFKKIFNMLKKDFKGYPFYELVTKASNEVLREKVTSIGTLNLLMNGVELINEFELAMIHHLNYKYNFLIKVKNDYSHLDNLVSKYNFERNKDEFALNFVAESNALFMRNSFELDKIDFYLSYLGLREYNANKFDDENLEKFHHWLIRDEEVFFNEKPLIHLAIYMKYKLLKFSTLSFIERVTKKMLEPDVFSKMHDSNTVLVSYLFEKVEFFNENLRNEFFDNPTVNHSLGSMLRYNEEVFIKKLNILPERFFVNYISTETLDNLIDNQLKLISLIEENKITQDSLKDPLFLMKYIEKYRTYDFVNFLQSLYKFMKSSLAKSNKDEHLLTKEIYNELHEAITQIKAYDEDLIDSSLKKYFVSSEKDALDTIELLSLNTLGYSFKYNMERLLEARKQIAINLFSIETVQKEVFNKIKSVYEDATDSYARNDMDYLILLIDFHKQLREVDFLTDESKEKLDIEYKNILKNLDLLKNQSLFEEILSVYNETKETSLSV